MNTPNEVQAIPEDVVADIKLGDALARLQKNKDYKAIIKEMYLEGGAINLTRNITVVKDKEEVVRQIEARGYLYRFLMELESNAESAHMAIAEMQSEQEEL